MTCRTETTQIGERSFSTTQWSAEKAFLMKLKLVKIFGAPIATIAAGVSGGKMNSKDVEALADGINILFEKAEPEQIMSIFKQCIVQNVFCDEQRITDTTFNQVFSTDDLLEIYKVFIFVIRTNYGNLFKGQKAQDLLAKVQEKV